MSTYAVATDKGVYIVNIQGSQVNNIAHMLATKDVSTLRNIGDKLICGTYHKEGYFLVDYKKKEEKKLCEANDYVKNMDLLSLIDAKYSNLVITRETTSLNILNITTATLTKLVDIPRYYWLNDNLMQVIPKDKDNFSVVVIDLNNKEILKFTVKTALLDVLIA